MISYELAKQLKDAGFPQKKDNAKALLLNQENPLSVGPADTIGDVVTSYYAPTLEELIDACGDMFWCLSKTENPLPREEWSAEGENEFHDYDCYGSTPSEAVARLYLALKEHGSAN